VNCRQESHTFMSAEDALFQRFGKDIPKGTFLFHEGEPGKEMYVIQAGKIAISKKVRDVEKVLAVLGPGEFFGEMAIISNKPRNASAFVEEEARLLVIDPRTFESMIRGNSEISVRMIKKLAERLADADAQIENLLLADPNSRIVHHLLQLCQTRGKQTEEGVEVDFPVRELPRELGVGEPAIFFMVSRLERAGLIEVAGDKVSVRDTARLFDFLRYLEMKWKFGDL
jgi:CRP/FNR family cyclic AMP-dependent transcriptional regulator